MSDQARMGSTVLNRRAVVRGAVWSLPAVTVATTAPAFANASGSLGLSAPVASYQAPDRLTLSTTVEGAPGQAGVLTLRIDEAHLFGSVAIASGAPGTVTPLPDGTFTLTYPVTPGPFTTTLDLGEDTLAGQFRGTRGDDTVLRIAVSPSASDPAPVPVAHLAFPEIEPPVAASATWTSHTAVRVETTAVRLTADPQPSVGRFRVAITTPTATYLNANPPTVSNLAPGWMVDPLLTPYEAGGGWVLRFVTTQEAHSSLTGVPAHRGPGSFSVELDQDATGFFRENEAFRIDVSTDETAFGWTAESSKIEIVRRSADLGPRPPASAG